MIPWNETRKNSPVFLGKHFFQSSDLIGSEVSFSTSIQVALDFRKSSDGRFECPVCSKLFRGRSSVKRHLESMHSGKLFTCEICGLKVSRKDNLQLHLMSKHELERDTAKLFCEMATQSEHSD